MSEIFYKIQNLPAPLILHLTREWSDRSAKSRFDWRVERERHLRRQRKRCARIFLKRR